MDNGRNVLCVKVRVLVALVKAQAESVVTSAVLVTVLDVVALAMVTEDIW